jgi:putative spermidine/putrescine transport system permease protein
LVKPRNRPVTNVVAVFVVLITFMPIVLAQRYAQRSEES